MVRIFTPTRTPLLLPGAALLEAEAGLSCSPLDHLAVHLRPPLTSLLDLVGLSPRTYHLYRRQGRPITPEVSARLSHLTRVTEAAEAYFHEGSGSGPPASPSATAPPLRSPSCPVGLST